MDINFTQPFQIELAIDVTYQSFGVGNFEDTSIADVVPMPPLPGSPVVPPLPVVSPPNTPTGLTAVFGNPGSATNNEQVDLEWDNSSNNEDGFYILRSIDGGIYRQVGQTSEDCPSFVDNLPKNYNNGTPLAYEVMAYNGGGASLVARVVVVSNWSPYDNTVIMLTYQSGSIITLNETNIAGFFGNCLAA